MLLFLHGGVVSRHPYPHACGLCFVLVWEGTVRRKSCLALCGCHHRRRPWVPLSSLEALMRNYPSQYWHHLLHYEAEAEALLAWCIQHVSCHLAPHYSSWVRLALVVCCHSGSMSVLSWCLCFIDALFVGGDRKSNIGCVSTAFAIPPQEFPPLRWRWIVVRGAWM